MRKKKRKNGRPIGGGVTPKLVKVSAIKNDGSAGKMALDLGITPEAALKHVKKPEVQAAVLDARARALKKAGITLERTFLKIGKNLKKPSGPDMRHAIDKSLLLLGEGETATGPQTPPVIMPLIVVGNVPIKYGFIDVSDGNVKPAVSEVDPT